MNHLNFKNVCFNHFESLYRQITHLHNSMERTVEFICFRIRILDLSFEFANHALSNYL